MQWKLEGFATIGLITVLALTLPIMARAQRQKIRVIVENATIRMKPDIQSDTIKVPPIGSVFIVQRKTGEWYELRIPTEVGILVTGYIHEMFVEVIAGKDRSPEPEIEVQKKPERQEIPVPHSKPQEGSATRAELAIRGAYTTGYSINDQSYSDSFSEGILQSASSTGKVTSELEKPFGFDGSFNFYLIGGLGFQLRFDYNSKSNITEASKSTYQLNWTWLMGGSGNAEEEWPVEGNVNLIIISGNLIYKVKSVGMMAPYVSGGVSYYSGKLKVSTTGAYAGTWFSSPYRYIDYFDIPANIDKSFNGVGFNAGGGLDIAFSRNIGFSIDARYFFLKNLEESWKIPPGEYSSNINEGWTFTLSEENSKILQEGIDLLEFNSAFFKVSAGFIFMF